MNPTLMAITALSLTLAAEAAADPASSGAAPPETALMDPLATKDPAPKVAADAPVPPVAEFGARIGVTIPSGKLDPLNDLDDAMGPMMTVDLLLNLRLGTRFMLAPYAGAVRGPSWGEVGKACEAKSGSGSCEAAGITVGLMARFAFVRTAQVEAWGGYGFSRDWRMNGGRGFIVDLAGNEHHLLAGCEWFIRGSTRLGLFVDASFGTYDKATATGPGGTWTATSPQLHQWNTIGVQMFH